MTFQSAKVVSIDSDPDSYHSVKVDRGSPDYPMSVSALKEFAQCPARWIAGYESPESDAKRWGNLVDSMILIPDGFWKRFVVRPETYPAPEKHAKVKSGEITVGSKLPWNGNAEVCKEWAEDQIGKTIIKADEYGACKTAVDRLNAHESSDELIACSQKQVALGGMWKDKATGITFPVRGLMDLLPDAGNARFGKSLADLKTTRSANPGVWQRFCFQRGYHIQAAFYLDLYCAATGEDRCEFRHILSENYPPFHVEQTMLSSEFIELGRMTYRRALANYATCLKAKHWPGYACRTRIAGCAMIDIEPWMATAEVNEMEIIDEEQTTADKPESQFLTP